MWKIGNVEIPERICAAPLAGISNPVYRRLMHAYGAGLVVSEMISDKALHYGNKHTEEMCRVLPDEHPVALQLFGSDPVTMAEASRFLSTHTECDIIDINMGCPVTKVLKAHSGSWLMKEPELAYDIVQAVRANTERPVTVKIRAGWDREHINCAEFAAKMEAAGAAAVAVHGRTRSQMYEGKSDNRYIRMVRDAVKIPVIGNGDIRTAEDMHRMFAETWCDAVMVGRGLLGRPYFLQELRASLHGETTAPVNADQKIDLCLEYTRELCAYEGEMIAIRMMRGMAQWYIAGMPYSASVKNRISTVSAYAELEEVLEEYRRKLKEREDEA
ncbi:MAG: tRNA dihydrouridine synthase DusB [Solobacterium sp.]|nr:tRNA dihydrouridine synthase DusB [Solobacterium sp.]